MNIPALITALVLMGIALLLVLYPLWQQPYLQNASKIRPSGQTFNGYTEANICPQCGNFTQVDDAFCARCGKALN